MPGASVELAYHRLAIGDPDALDGLDAEAIAALERSAADLPPTTRGLLGSAAPARRRSARSCGEKPRSARSRAAARRALDAGDLEAADRLLAGGPAWSSTTRLHRLEAQLAEARGDLQAAVAATERDVAAALLAEEPERYCAAVIRLALLLWERLSRPAELSAS